MRWVKLTLRRAVRPRWLFRIWRLTSSSLAGTSRTEVAVGTPRLASMFSTMRAAAPRIGLGVSPSSRIGAAAPVVRGSAGGSWRSVTDDGGADGGAEGGAGSSRSAPSPLAGRAVMPGGE